MARPKKQKIPEVVSDADAEDDLIGTVDATDTEDTKPICPIDGGPYGDKAEGVVDWWFNKHPDLAAEKYKNRKTHRN